MLNNREIDPTKLMVSDQGFTFAELAALNDGVILGPLASNSPVSEVDPFVAQGLAAFSGNAIKSFISEYTIPDEDGPGEEFLRLLARHKAIKASVPTTSLLKDVGYPSDVPKPSKPSVAPEKTPEELYSELIFGDDKPKFHRVGAIIVQDPHNPDNVTFIEELFSSNGYDLTDPENELTANELASAISNTYREQVFINFRMPAAETDLIDLTCQWVESIGDSIWEVGVGLRLGFVRSVLNNFDKTNTKPALMNELIERYKVSAGSVISAEKNAVRKRELASRLQEILENRMDQYPVVNILTKYGIVRRDGTVRPFNPIFANSFADVPTET